MTLVLAQATAPFGERLLLAAVGPLVTVVVGSGLIGLALWKVTNRAQQRREDAARDLEQQRADHELRHDLLAEATRIAATLYLTTQHYWRVYSDGAGGEELAAARTALDRQYRESRVDAAVLEARLDALYSREEVAEAWHRVDDLLTVRYMQLIERATPRLLAENAMGRGGRVHSGLTAAELRRPKTVLTAYHGALRAATRLILTAPLRATAGPAGAAAVATEPRPAAAPDAAPITPATAASGGASAPDATETPPSAAPPPPGVARSPAADGRSAE